MKKENDYYMKQSFIVLGEGLTDLFEFTTLIEYNYPRIDKIVYLHSPQSTQLLSSVVMIMHPTSGKHFQAMYMMLNALKYPYPMEIKNSNSLITRPKNITFQSLVLMYNLPKRSIHANNILTI